MAECSGARKLSRREELGVESRRRIVDVVAAPMAERGFAGTSIAAVSQRSGLPSGSIYWHFESKEARLGAVVEEGERREVDATSLAVIQRVRGLALAREIAASAAREGHA